MRPMGARWRSPLPTGRLAQGALLVMFWQACRLSALAIWVVVAARVLGSQGYGAFAGIVGLATVVAGFSGWGVGNLMYQRTAISRSQFSPYWRKTLIAYSTSGAALGLCFIVIARWMFPQSGMQLLALVLVSEILVYPFVASAALAFAAHERMGWSAALPAIGALFRFLALAIYAWAFGGRDLVGYLAWHSLASCLAAAASLYAAQRLLAPGRASCSLGWQDLRDSWSYCLVWFTSVATASWDKALVLRLAGSEISGLYAAAYRFATLAAMPIDSLVMAAMPRLFRRGSGDASAPGLLRQVFFVVVGYGLLAGAGLALVAPVLAWLLGPSFSIAGDVCRGIALMIPLYGLRQLAGHVLVAHDRRKERAVIDLLALVLMTVLAIGLVPRFGLTGAVFMIVATELTLVLLTWSAVVRYVIGKQAGPVASRE